MDPKRSLSLYLFFNDLKSQFDKLDQLMSNSANIFTRNNNSSSGNSSGQGQNQYSTRSNTNLNQNNSSAPTANIFTQNSANNQNIFSANRGTSNNSGSNVFNNGSSGQGNNIFGGNNQGSNMFNGNNQGNNSNNNSGSNIFGNNSGNNSGQGNIFGNNTGNNQGNNSGNNQGNIFNNNNNQGGNIFNGGNNQGSNNIFNNGNNNNSQGNNGNIFNRNGNNTNQNNINYQGNNVRAALTQMKNQLRQIKLSNFSAQDQKQIVKQMSKAEIRQFIEYHLHQLIEPHKIDSIKITDYNLLKNRKANEVLSGLNFKNQTIFLKKYMKEMIDKPLQNMKIQSVNLQAISKKFAFELNEKLIKLKQQLIQSTKYQKMIASIKKQLQQIDNEIIDFINPTLNDHQNKRGRPFIDPDSFCLQISQKILKGITYLDNKMDELLACESDSSEDVDITIVIGQLATYYENVAICFQQFNQKYNRAKKGIKNNSNLGYSEGNLQKINKKAKQHASKQLGTYQKIKQIESLLQKIQKNHMIQ